MYPGLGKLLLLSILLVIPSTSSPIVENTNASGTVQIPDDVSYFSPDGKSNIERQAVPSIKHFYDVTGSRYEPLWDDMSSQGYRLISLSIYGPHTAPRFAVVYKRETGPRLWSVYNVKQERWDEWVREVKDNGWSLTAVSATGTLGNVRYAGLAEKANIDYYHSCGLNSDQVSDTNREQREQGRIIKTIRQYGGTGTSRRYCVLFHASQTFEKYTLFKNMERDEYKINHEVEMTKRYWYPTFISMSEDKRYSAVFTNVYRGSTHSDSKMTAKELEDKIIEQKNEGKFLYSLQASGSGSDVVFAGLWSSLTVQPRTWRTRTGANTGVPSTFKSSVDNLFQNFMKQSSVRQAQFAVGRNATILFERAYTWSESARVSTHPSDKFYLASVSKPFAAAAAQTLYDSGQLTPDTKILPLLTLHAPPLDRRFANITVSHLINHQAGFDRSIKPEGNHMMREVAQEMSAGTRPASMSDLAIWISKRGLDFAPGDKYAYSNDGYQLLGRVVENVSGREYYNQLKRAVLDPLGLDVGFFRTDVNLHADDRVIQEDWRTGLSALHPLSTTLVANVFGGSNRYHESSKSATSLTASAGTLTKFASRYALQGSGDRRIGCKSGSTSGARTRVCAAPGRWDWAAVFSSRDFPWSADGVGSERFDVLMTELARLVDGLEG